MSQILVPGQNIPLSGAAFALALKTPGKADFSAFLLDSSGKTTEDGDFVFYGQPETPDGSVRLLVESGSATFRVNPDRLPARAEKVAFAVTPDGGVLASLDPIDISISALPSGTSSSWSEIARCVAKASGRSELALVLCEIYRRNGAWKFRFIDQGFSGGLKPLAEHFGVEIADGEREVPPPPPPSPAPKPENRVSLSKITLTKGRPSVSLDKTGGGIWKVNLNWSQGKAAERPKGLFGGLFGGKDSGRGAIDLDLGACIRMKNGRKDIVQAVGGNFGSTARYPWVQLMGDDRTGEQAGGEWLQINGDMIAEIRDIFIFAFIYDGVPNWSATDGVVRLFIPGQPEIETRLEGSDNSCGMCAIARVFNENGRTGVEKLDRYFRSHKEMDRAFGWGFSWVAGRK